MTEQVSKMLYILEVREQLSRQKLSIVHDMVLFNRRVKVLKYIIFRYQITLINI